jgi:ATP-binding cassette, subfamily B, bacterial MsbA
MKNRGTEIYRRLFAYAWPYRRRIALAMVASLGIAASDALLAKQVQPFMDRVIVAGDWDMARLVPLFIIGIFTFKGASRYIQEYFIQTSGQLVMQDLRNDLYGHSVSLSMGYFSRTQAGTLMSRVLNDVGVMQGAVADVLVIILRESVTLVALTGVAFYMDWKLAALAFVVIPTSILPVVLIGRKIKAYSRRGQGAIGAVTTRLEQTFSGIKVIKGFGTEAREKEKFRRENLNYYRFIRKIYKYGASASPLLEIITAIGLAAVLWFGLSRIEDGTMTQGELFAVIAAIMLMYTPVKRLTRVHHQMQQALGAAERVFEVLETPRDVQDQPGARHLGRARGQVVFDHVRFAYEDIPVVDDLSFVAEPGEVVALVGPSGAGKSTAVGLVARFYDVTGGAVKIDGQDVREVTLDSLRANLALVDQETFLFHETIADNIRYGRPQATDTEVEDAARQAFADEFITQMPDGYQTVIGDRGVRLSGGQRQRLCIARALLRNAPILILDEATSALDTESEAMVQKALTNLMQGRTTLVIAHRLSTIMHADKIVVLEDGRMVAMGSHQQLLEQDGLYRKLYDMQFQEKG